LQGLKILNQDQFKKDTSK